MISKAILGGIHEVIQRTISPLPGGKAPIIRQPAPSRVLNLILVYGTQLVKIHQTNDVQ
jgi:hypothetical protein